jgi:hypothetical protein
MHQLLRGMIVAAATTCALLVGAAGGLAAPGNGALVVPTFCSIILPGIGTAEGPGKVVLLPNGGEVIKCSADLLSTAIAPAKVVRIESAGCISIVLPNGSVNATCRL